MFEPKGDCPKINEQGSKQPATVTTSQVNKNLCIPIRFNLLLLYIHMSSNQPIVF